MNSQVEIRETINTLIEEVKRLSIRVEVLELKNESLKDTIQPGNTKDIDFIKKDTVLFLKDDEIKQKAIEIVLKNDLTTQESIISDHSLQTLLYESLKTLDFEHYEDIVNGLYFTFCGGQVNNRHGYIYKTFKNALNEHDKGLGSVWLN